MSYFQIFITTLFLGINIWIVLADIRERKIPNILLIYLLGLLPIWYIAFPIRSTSQIIIWWVFSLILLIFGIFLYKKDTLLWSGDIKYTAILVLFLWQYPLSIFIGNTAILTLLCLSLWVVIIILYIYQFRWSLHLDTLMNDISPTIPKNEIYLYILAYILDWGIVGFMISQLIPKIWIILGGELTAGTDIYFLIFMIVYIIRPWANFLITRWRYNILPIVLICIYFMVYIQNNSIYILYSEMVYYVSSLWFYILLYITIYYISTSLYRIYDRINTIRWKERLQTIPYSIVIFLAFMIPYSLKVEIIHWISTIF